MRRLSFIFVLTIAAGIAAASAAVTLTQLPSGWWIGSPPAAFAATGTMPQGIALSPDAKHLAVVESGAGPSGIRVFEVPSLHQSAYLELKNAFGKPVWDDNAHVWLALASQHAIGFVNTDSGQVERTIDTGDKTWPAAIALSPDRKTLATTDDNGAAVLLVDVASGKVTKTIATASHPGDIAFAPGGSTLAWTNRAGSTISTVPAAGSSTPRTIEVGRHPTALAFASNTTLYVAASDDDAVARVDLGLQTRTASINVGIHNGPVNGWGASPNALALTADGTVLVTNGAQNSLALIKGTKLVSRLSTGWYPDGAAVAGNTAYVIDGKGESSRPNPQFSPFARHGAGYVAASLAGSVRAIDLRTPDQTRTVIAFISKGLQIPANSIVRPNGPIKHVIYLIKENRSYDQVLGDIPGAAGDPSLTLFGKDITPNQHAIASRFGVLDHAFTNSQVSADGHNWTDAGFANDYLERFWPPLYGGKRQLYDFEDGAVASVPHNGYLWDAAARAHITYRNYGEFVTNATVPGGDVSTQEAALKEHTDLKFPGFDLEISDLDRFNLWNAEFRTFERSGALPALEIVRVPNDHTEGTRAGSLTPQAYVAQNDYAIGKIVEAVSHSRYWRDTVIFSVEDDAQNGPDHIDDQRSTFYLASPYARGGVIHARYSTASVLHTFEIMLGMKPLSIYDATATPLYEAFSQRPNMQPFVALKPTIDMNAVNKKTAYGAQISAKMDFTHEDRADFGQLNDILYHAVRKR